MPSERLYLVRVAEDATESAALQSVPSPPPTRRTGVLQRILLLVGLVCLGFYGYTLANEYVYQAFENWAFDQQITGRPQVSFADYVREATPFGFIVDRPEPPHVAPPTPQRARGTAAGTERPAAGALLGRVEIPRLALSAIVREGVDTGTLSRAVGHVPSTALAGGLGNFAIAAHRDTLFRALKYIREGDVVTFQSPSARYTYEVFTTRIVKPSEVSVLRADGGLGKSGDRAVMPVSSNPDHLLTMITCYPFYFVGSAPQRFIVQARLISTARLNPHRT